MKLPSRGLELPACDGRRRPPREAERDTHRKKMFLQRPADFATGQAKFPQEFLLCLSHNEPRYFFPPWENVCFRRPWLDTPASFEK